LGGRSEVVAVGCRGRRRRGERKRYYRGTRDPRVHHLRSHLLVSSEEEKQGKKMMKDENQSSQTGTVFSEDTGGGGRLYNPYADLYGAADLKSIESVYRLPTKPEHLFPDEAAVERRNLSENLTYYTGCGYLSGAAFGGIRGFGEGLRSREEGDTLKIRVNRLLNASGHRGRSTGNTFGILGLLYAGMESGTYYLRGTDDILNNIMAGLATGAAYKAAAGFRTAAIAGALGGIAAGGLVGAKQFSRRYLAF
jgi:import inner membrane translocase subunit TIM23